MAQDVFISYAVEDKEVADKVCRALEGQGLKCWIAPRDVPYGADYEEAIVDAITTSPLLVLVLSTHSNASPHVKREIQNACVEGSGTEIVPFRIADVPYNKALRYYLGSAQWLDASTPPLEQHLGPLVEHVRERLNRTRGRVTHPTEVIPMPRRAHSTPDDTDEVRRKPLPLMWIAVGAGALLVAVVVVAFMFATRSNRGGNATNNSANANLATPVVNSNRNEQASPTPQTRTPTPTPTPRPMRTPIRPIPTNLNLRRPLNRNN